MENSEEQKRYHRRTKNEKNHNAHLKSVTQGLLDLKIKATATTVRDLPDDVLINILSRNIPVITLLQWKTVSKRFQTLLQNPNFISLHHARSQENPSEVLTLTRRLNGTSFIAQATVSSPTAIGNINLSFIGRHVVLSDSANGLLCLCNRSETLICNPAIREFRVLPSPFRQTQRIPYLGFWFDCKDDDYKAVMFVTRNCYPCDKLPYPRIGANMEEHFHCDKTKCMCKRPVCFPNVYVYAMGSDAWRQTDAVAPDYCIYHVPQCYRCASSDGVFYFLAHDHAAGFMHVCVFRASEEVFESVPLPGIFRLKLLSNLCLLKDSLALVLSDLQGQGPQRVDTCFDIWVMDEYGVQESWTKKYSLGPLLGTHSALGFRPGVEVLLTRHDYKTMVAYNLCTQEMVEYDPLHDTPESGLLDEVFHYAESLISVKRLSLKKKKANSKKKKSSSKKKN